MRNSRALVVFVVLTFAVICIPRNAHAQLEHNVWFFGGGFGLDFGSEPPTLLRHAGLQTIEGSASICDPETGIPLFYTDGLRVWNSDHQVMPNGVGLHSDVSSSQAALIVPDPGDRSNYYIFTVDQSGYRGPSRGISYSIVDMTLDGAKGDVTVKNVNLLQPTTERITAVKLCDGAAYWIIGHELGSARHFAWYLDANGINTTPVISNIGTVHGPSWEEGIGWMSASPDGTKLALAFYLRPSALPHIELYRFDPITGIVSNPVNLYKSIQPYGVAFSPNGRFLYATSVERLEQFDLTNWDWESIERSQWTAPSNTVENGAIKLGPNGKLYVQHSAFMSHIEYPDLQGVRCRYQNAFLMGDLQSWGLPNNVDAHFNLKCGPPQSLIRQFDTLICIGECVSFYDSSSRGAVQWQWEFEGSTPQSFIGKDATGICYSTAGRYSVKLIASNESGSDTAFATITVRDCPVPDISIRDTTICKGQSIVFSDTSSLDAQRTWAFELGEPASAQGSITPEIRYLTLGTHKVTFIASNEFGADTAIAFVTVEDCPDPVALAEFDSVICVGEPLAITDRSLNAPSEWSWSFEGATPSSATEQHPKNIIYAEAGRYSIRQIVRNAMTSDTAYHTIRVSDCLPPLITLEDRVLCQGDSINLRDASLYEPTSWEWTMSGTHVQAFYGKDPGHIVYDSAGTFTIRLIAANEYGADTAESTVTVHSAEPHTEGSIEIFSGIDLCSFIDTFFTIHAGCKALEITSIISQDPALQLNLVAGSLDAQGSLRIPFIVAPTEIGIHTGVISFTVNGKEYLVQVRYNGTADDEQFTFGALDTDFSSLPCDSLTRELTITNNACAEHTLASAYITPPNSGFAIVGQTVPFQIASAETASLFVRYDASLAPSANAELVLITAAGLEKRIELNGTRLLPRAGSIRVESTSPRSLLPNDQTSVRVTLVDPIAAEIAPEEMELTFSYNTDILSVGSINAQGGWQVAQRDEHDGRLMLLLRRPRNAVEANSTVLDLAFESFLTTESTTQFTLDRVRCNPQDPVYESCVYRLEATDTSRIAILNVCGTDEMQRLMGRSSAISLNVHPHPVKASEDLHFTVDVGDASIANQPMIVELIDLLGKRSIILETSSPQVSSEYSAPLASIPEGVYVLQVSIGDVIQTRTIVIE